MKSETESTQANNLQITASLELFRSYLFTVPVLNIKFHANQKITQRAPARTPPIKLIKIGILKYHDFCEFFLHEYLFQSVRFPFG